MNRETENVLLLLVGVSGVLVVSTGTYLRYVKPTLLPWLLAGAAVIIVLALSAIAGDIRRGGSAPGGHLHRAPAFWLLALPVVVLLFVTPPPIGGSATVPAASAPTGGPRHPFPALPPGPAPEVALPDVLMRVAQDSAGTLEGRRISVTGFVLHTDGHVELGRVVIICCAADAQLARIRLTGAAAAEAARLPDNSWTRVEGTVTVGPTLQIDSVTPVEPPANTYTY